MLIFSVLACEYPLRVLMNRVSPLLFELEAGSVLKNHPLLMFLAPPNYSPFPPMSMFRDGVLCALFAAKVLRAIFASPRGRLSPTNPRLCPNRYETLFSSSISCSKCSAAPNHHRIREDMEGSVVRSNVNAVVGGCDAHRDEEPLTVHSGLGLFALSLQACQLTLCLRGRSCGERRTS